MHDAAGPPAHDVDGVGEIDRLAQIVRHQHAGEALLQPQRLHDAPQLLAGEGVERAERLVEHQQLGLVDQGAAEVGALLHAARELPGIACRAKSARPTVSSSFIARASYSARLRRKRRLCGSHHLHGQQDVVHAWCARASASGSGRPCRRP